jgi:hypothetical protein
MNDNPRVGPEKDCVGDFLSTIVAPAAAMKWPFGKCSFSFRFQFIPSELCDAFHASTDSRDADFMRQL